MYLYYIYIYCKTQCGFVWKIDIDVTPKIPKVPISGPKLKTLSQQERSSLRVARLHDPMENFAKPGTLRGTNASGWRWRPLPLGPLQCRGTAEHMPRFRYVHGHRSNGCIRPCGSVSERSQTLKWWRVWVYSRQRSKMAHPIITHIAHVSLNFLRFHTIP